MSIQLVLPHGLLPQLLLHSGAFVLGNWLPRFVRCLASLPNVPFLSIVVTDRLGLGPLGRVDTHRPGMDSSNRRL